MRKCLKIFFSCSTDPLPYNIPGSFVSLLTGILYKAPGLLVSALLYINLANTGNSKGFSKTAILSNEMECAVECFKLATVIFTDLKLKEMNTKHLFGIKNQQKKETLEYLYSDIVMNMELELKRYTI